MEEKEKKINEDINVKDDSVNDAENTEAKETEDNKETDSKEALETDKTEDCGDSEKDELKKKAEDYLDKYQRTLAEFDNFRKRTIKEKASMYDDGIRDFALNLIPVIDNFDRAVSSVSEEEKETGLYKGIEMVLKQFTEILTSMGVKEIEAQGQPFDPNLHNAVMHIEDEKYDENVIVSVLQKGYICKDKVIRPSMVQVAN